MRKVILYAAVIAVIGFGILQFKPKAPLYHSQSYVFGTLVDISIYGETDERARAVTNLILQDFQHLHHRFHAWKTDTLGHASELGQLNEAFAKGTSPIEVQADLANIIRDATALSVKSNGLFNPAIGHLVSAWGFQRDEFSAVQINQETIENLVQAAPRMTDIVLNKSNVYSKNSSVKLDLGGYAKGYALDLALQRLRQEKIKHALVNIGGNIIALGQHGQKPWRVGIQHPRAPTAIATLDLADGWAIGTSGDYQRYFFKEKQRYCHIIDPRTGYPVQHTQSVTVLIPPQSAHQIQAGVLSDVATKPIFIASPENKNQMAKKFGIEYLMVIDEKSNILISKKLAKNLHWQQPDVQFSTFE